MDNNCENCPSKCGECDEQNRERKYTVKFRIELSDLGDYSKKEIENKLNGLEGVKDAVIKDEELIIDYDDILVSPEKLKEILT